LSQPGLFLRDRGADYSLTGSNRTNC
jgi:hypothetical protein